MQFDQHQNSASLAQASNDEQSQDDQRQRSTDQNGNDKDQEKQVVFPKPVGFWDSRLKHVRGEAFTKWIITTAILMTFILAVLSIYWGALLHVEQNLPSLTVYVVDFDAAAAPYNTSGVQPIVGPALTRLARQMLSNTMPSVGWQTLPPADFNYDPLEVRRAVYDFKAWAAIVINSNATSALYSATQNGNSSYDPMGACQLVYQDGRDDTNWFDFIAPIMENYMTEATIMVGEQWTRMVLQNVTSNTTLLNNISRVPQALSPAIGFSRYNLRPFYPYQVIPSVSIGLIYLIILSFFSFSFYLPIHMKYLKPDGHPPLKFAQLILWRWCATVSAYFMLSLAYSLVSLAFQINFAGTSYPTSEILPTSTGHGNTNPGAYGHGTFVVYWMLNFFGMIALGMASENVSMLVGQPWTGLWLIFWVITNVSTSFYDIQIEPGFFRWGCVWPLHYVVEGSRQILFDLHSRIGLDFGVLIAWGAVNSAMFPLACYFMRWKSQHHVHEYYK